MTPLNDLKGIDHAGALLIATAIAFLCSRVALAFFKTRAVRDALRVHHARPSPSIWERVCALPFAVHVLLGACVLAALPVSLGWEGPLWNALWVSLRWGFIAMVIRAARRRFMPLQARQA